MPSTVATNIRYPSISAELIEMRRVDQLMRNEAMADPNKWNSDVDRRNSIRLAEIVEEIGWPTRSKVGSEASSAAWLLAQHADLDRTFQQRALSLMKECSATEVDPQNIAYLEDRVLTGQGLPQLYGTQCRLEGDKISPFPIQDDSHVDERRAAIGLPPLAEYLAGFARLKG